MSDKIDWPTLKMPVGPTISQPLGFGYSGDMTRIGNVVYLRSWGKFTQNISDGVVLVETIPDGYKPAAYVYSRWLCADSGNPVSGVNSSRIVSWTFSSTGKMTIYGNARANDIFQLTVSWITNDDWPS